MIASYNEHTAVLVSAEAETVVAASSLIDDFDTLVDQDTFSDVTFMVESRPIYAHRAILAARSEHFRAMFSSGMRESNSDTIPIANTRYDIFLALLRYIYTDRVDLSAEDAAELYMTAEMYRLDRLKDLCQMQVLAQLSTENAPTILGVADSMASLHLRTLCIKFIVRNFDEVSKVDAFNELSRDLIIEVLQNR
jgi:RCC1 and BTB domain-containing protein